MGVRDLLADQGKKLVSSPFVLRLISNDRVMKVATGVMDARTRLRAAAEKMAEAGTILVEGHGMPNIDPALDGEPEVTARLAQVKARIYEVPISYSGRTYAEGKKIGMRDAFWALWCLIRY